MKIDSAKTSIDTTIKRKQRLRCRDKHVKQEQVYYARIHWWEKVMHEIISKLSANGDHQECLRLCQEQLETNQDSAFLWKYAGKSLMQLNQLKKAQQCLEKSRQLNEQDPETIKDIGNIYNALQNEEEAISYYKLAINIDSDYAPAYNNLGLLAKRQGNLLDAKRLLEKACNIDKLCADYRMNLGIAYKRLGNLEQALMLLEKSIELEPENFNALINLGGTYKETGDLNRALCTTLKATKLKPNNAVGQMNLGVIYEELGDLDNALNSMMKSLNLDPYNAIIHLNLGKIYKKMMKFDSALSSTIKSLELNPNNNSALVILKGIYDELCNHDKYLKKKLSSMNLNPNTPAGNTNTGWVYMYLGNLDEALKSTLKSDELKPNDPTTLANLSAIYRDLGLLDKALDSAIKSLELNPNNPSCHINIGCIYRELGELDKGIAACQDAIKLNPNNEMPYINLSSIYLDQDKLDEALKCIRKSLELNETNYVAHLNLAKIHLGQGRLDEALASNLKCLELNANDYEVHINLSLIYNKMKKLDEAISSIINALSLNKRSTKALMNLGHFYEQQCKFKLSQETYIQAWKLEPNSLDKYIYANRDASNILDSDDHIESIRNNLKKISGHILKNPDLEYNDKGIQALTFNLAYHNRTDDKELIENFTKALKNNNGIKKVIDNGANIKKDRKANQKTRVAVISDFLGHHAVGFHFNALIKYLEESGLDVEIFGFNKVRQSNQSEGIETKIKQTKLPESIQKSCTIVRKWEPDIVLFTEIGMSAHTLILALARMAPVQAVMAGHPSTTGMDSIDYFISSELLEEPDNQKFYTEQLIRLTKIPSMMELPATSGEPINRKAMGLPESKTLIGFPHTLFKLHPDFDSLLEKILNKDENIRLVFINTPSKYHGNKIRERWKRDAPIILERSIFFDEMPLDSYLRLLAHLDLVLDPLYFGSGTAFMHAAAVGTPVVTLPTEQMRARSALACYKLMEIENPPIAKNITEYIDLCLKLSKSKNERERIREQLIGKAKYLFNNSETLDEMRQFIVDSVECAYKGKKLDKNWRPTS